MLLLTLIQLLKMRKVVHDITNTYSVTIHHHHQSSHFNVFASIKHTFNFPTSVMEIVLVHLLLFPFFLAKAQSFFFLAHSNSIDGIVPHQVMERGKKGFSCLLVSFSKSWNIKHRAAYSSQVAKWCLDSRKIYNY